MTIHTKSPQTSEIFCLVVTNALDFLNKAISELSTSPKYSVINFYSAVELLLKAKLLLEHWSLIVARPDLAIIGKFSGGDFVSVGLSDSIKRLENIAGEQITKKASDSFDALRNHRNKLVHFSTPEYFASPDDAALQEVITEQCRVWFYLHELLTQYWSEDFSEYLSDIDEFDQSMHKKVEYLKAKYDLLEPKIKREISNGVRFIDCPFCNYNAVRFVSTSQTCLVCGNVTAIKNPDLAYMGVVLGGPFTISPELAREMLEQSTKNSHINNADVIKPWRNGKDIVLNTQSYVIDFGEMPQEEAEKYTAPFQYILENVYPIRKNSRNKKDREFWWQFSRPRYDLRQKLIQLEKYIATPATSKHSFFVWLDSEVVPAQQITIIATSDSYVFGVLHSRCHAVWIELTASRLRDLARYTPSVFKDFPFPYHIQENFEQINQPYRVAIGELADQLNSFRNACLQNHSEQKSLEETQSELSMTQLYNDLSVYRAIPVTDRMEEVWETRQKVLLSFAEVATLDNLHAKLDETVLKAYGWQPNLTDDEIAEKLNSYLTQLLLNRRQYDNFDND